MEQQDIQQVQIRRDKLPLFSDLINIELEIKANKKDLKEKEFYTRLMFVDTKTAQVVSEVVISRLLTKDLYNVLRDILNKSDEIIKTGKLPKQPLKSTSEAPSYLG